jgi:proteasome ATPase
MPVNPYNVFDRDMARQMDQYLNRDKDRLRPEIEDMLRRFDTDPRAVVAASRGDKAAKRYLRDKVSYNPQLQDDIIRALDRNVNRELLLEAFDVKRPSGLDMATIERAKRALLGEPEVAGQEEVQGKPNIVGVVIDRREQDVFVAAGNLMHIKVPKKLKLNPGETVLIDAESGKIVGKADGGPVIAAGRIGFIKAIEEKQSEVELDGSTIFVNNGLFVGDDAPKKGDRVIVDNSGSVIIKNLGKKSTDFTPESIPDISWDDIGGLEEAKRQMIEAVELPHKEKELFAFYGKRPSRGVLLYGPPGCGKTLLAKAAANSLAKIYEGQETASSFIYIKGPEILNKYVGASEAAIRDIFARARAHHAEHGYPAIIFIDEAEAILSARGREGTTSSIIGQTIVPMFLAEMDGFDATGAMVILATNRPDALDPAITRDGRIDRKIKITRPTLTSTVDILRMNLKKTPVVGDVDAICQAGAIALFDSDRVLYTFDTRKGQRRMTLGDIANGGMVAGVVDYAISLAIRRSMSEPTAEKGICEADILAAVDHIDNQCRDLNHDGDINEFAEPFKNEITNVTKGVKNVAANETAGLPADFPKAEAAGSDEQNIFESRA